MSKSQVNKWKTSNNNNNAQDLKFQVVPKFRILIGIIVFWYHAIVSLEGEDKGDEKEEIQLYTNFKLYVSFGMIQFWLYILWIKATKK